MTSASLPTEELKARPVGKADYSCRSCLHDDISVVVVQFSDAGGAAPAQPRQNLGMPPSQPGPVGGAAEASLWRLTDAFAGMSATQLRILFDALDTDGYGTLGRRDVQRLVASAMPQETDLGGVVNACLSTLDSGRTGAVAFDEFCKLLLRREGGSKSADVPLQHRCDQLEAENARLREQLVQLEAETEAIEGTDV